jgi:hypothetical protein
MSEDLLGSNIDPLDHDADGAKGGSLPKAKRAAAKKSKKDEAGYIWIILEENDDIPPTGLPLGHNGTAYLVRPGEPVQVPVQVLNVLDDAVTSVPVRESGTDRVIGHRERMRFPYRRVAAPVVDE